MGRLGLLETSKPVSQAQFSSLICLQMLRLANNSLTGKIPPTATTARNLFMLDLQSNKLSGPLPDNWATPALQMLMLEDNRFTG